ncbi:glycosyltransferase [Nonomuraea sp. NPDC050310]|uniref:glycosyltransferase family 2 protein n=1 Tax=Nonomuraea sp. NPDC050310 TaxID=3154935 RepID=UPI0033E2F41A
MKPSIGVVVPTTGDRPDQLRAAVEAVLAQAYDGELDVVVVVDGADERKVAHDLADVLAPDDVSADAAMGEVFSAGRRVATGVLVPAPVQTSRPRVRVLPNRLSPGLPGSRNTGISACATEFIAFCDDDDLWLPGKLAAQVKQLVLSGAEFASCAIEVAYGKRRVSRLAGTDTVTQDDLSRSRMVMVHSSTFLFRRGTLWADESAPGGQNEDWDLALRAAKRQPIVHVDRPLVRVTWGASHYATRWADRIAGLEWMLARHPELAVDPRGAARIYGQLAFHHAALGQRREAARWARRTLTTRPGEPRGPLALAVAAGLVPARTVLSLLHGRGRGI